ncbi:MAG: helicase-associated domain-containing protein, partial [Spirochaetaceae bacterium]|nr:helicase-associated domain-containing protein [Spirochaetaceae bacterium]
MKTGNPDNPLIIQSDSTLLLDVHNKNFAAARNDIAPFAELEKSPEHIHTYRISPLSLWNAASAGLEADQIIDNLEKWSRFEIPENIIFSINDIISRFGKLVLRETEDPNRLILSIEDKMILAELSSIEKLKKYLIPMKDGFYINLVDRGTIKLELIKIGYPVKDEAPLIDGDHLDIKLRETTRSGFGLIIRDYQIESAETFCGDGNAGTGFGVIVLPCGAGKTIVGMQVMDILKTNTLILTTNVAAVHQWIEELKDKTQISDDDIGEYTGDRKLIKPVTVATYQILTWRPDSDSDFPHFSIFRKKNWGLIIYDEVHLLPAPVFRVTAEIQSMRRLGLTATLVREDGRQKDVFSLVGPKRYDVPWKELEAKGWIAEANCYEIRMDLPENLKIDYAVAEKRKKFRIASENFNKITIVKQLIKNHREDSILVIGQYIEQLKSIA